MKAKSKEEIKIYIRNSIFGVEDSLVSTVGLLSGVAVAGVPKSTILLVGIVLIFVEAISMAAGSFLSEQSVREYTTKEKSASRLAVVGGIIMFFSYFVSGFIPLFPYLIFEVEIAFWVSIFISFLTLFILGAYSAKVFGAKIWKSGLRMLFVGGLAISIGVIIGTLLQ